ncbi:MAG: hypothetical protein J0H98_11840 [Solirubrobacterales bacterium]|nr:hypothetical protein [Solirubrobacterales bacterium]
MVTSNVTPVENETPLDLAGYRAWALVEGGGGPKGSVRRGGRGRPLPEQTVDADMKILAELGGLVQQRKCDPRDRSAMLEVAKAFRDQLDTRPPKDRNGNIKKEGKLSPLSVERYMIVARRYFRYAGLLEPNSPDWELLKGPTIRRSRTLFSPEELDAWFSVVSGREDKRIELATWLLLTEVPVASLVELAFADVDLARCTLQVGKVRRQIGPELGQLLSSAENRQDTDPLLISEARRHGGRRSRSPMTVPGLRSLWNDARLLVPGKGPTMAALLAVGRQAIVDRTAGESIYVFRDPVRLA